MGPYALHALRTVLLRHGEFIIYIYFTHITAWSTLIYNVRKYITHWIFNNNSWLFYFFFLRWNVIKEIPPYDDF